VPVLSRVILTNEAIPQVLASLGEPWASGPPSSAAASGGPSGAPRSGACSGAAGAWLDFFGIVRGTEAEPGNSEEAPIAALDYEAHEAMAVHQLERIVELLGRTHELQAMLVVHRIGLVPVGEASLLVRVLARHRGEALEACREFLDELKTWVPIWKQAVRRPPRPS
jgi:molybdopterin synthase catalytic subunit